MGAHRATANARKRRLRNRKNIASRQRAAEKKAVK